MVMVLADVDIRASIEFHHRHGKLATDYRCHPAGTIRRAGAVWATGSRLLSKSHAATAASSMAASSCCRRHVSISSRAITMSWESDPLTELAARGELMALSAPAASGSRWTRCGKRTCWKSFGRAARRRGRSGDDRADQSRSVISGRASASFSPDTPVSRALGSRFGFAGSALPSSVFQLRRRDRLRVWPASPSIDS